MRRYRVEDRKLLIVPEEAATVRLIFERYLALGSMFKLLAELRIQGVTTKVRNLSTGKTVGGIPFTQGPLAHLLANRVYMGEIVHKGQSYPGEHEAILDRAMFDAATALRAQNLVQHHAKRVASNALLLGKFFDDAGNVMSPTHSRKKGLRYRYYSSRALAEGRKSEAGSIARVAADDVESKVVEALLNARAAVSEAEASAPGGRELTQSMVSRVIVGKDLLTIQLTESGSEAAGQPSLSIPWARRPSKPKRDLVLPVDGGKPNPRPMYAEWRAKHRAPLLRGASGFRN